MPLYKLNNVYFKGKRGQGNHRTQKLIGMTTVSPEEIYQSHFKNLNERMKYEQELLAT